MKGLIFLSLFACIGFRGFSQEDSARIFFDKKWMDISLENVCCQVLTQQRDSIWIESNCIIEFMKCEEQELWDY